MPANGPPTWGNGLFIGLSRFWKGSAERATDTVTIYRNLSLYKVGFVVDVLDTGLQRGVAG
jgi:hypothetical protein